MVGQSELFTRDVKQGEDNNFLFLQMACLVGFFVVGWLFICLFFLLETAVFD